MFISAVKDALYSSQRTSSPLIESITNLCIPKRSGAKVKSIITYNFDDLIEESLSKVKLEYKTIYRDEEQHDSDELPIYHVHGFIPGRESFDKLLWSFQKRRTIRFILSHIIGLILFN